MAEQQHDYDSVGFVNGIARYSHVLYVSKYDIVGPLTSSLMLCYFVSASFWCVLKNGGGFTFYPMLPKSILWPLLHTHSIHNVPLWLMLFGNRQWRRLEPAMSSRPSGDGATVRHHLPQIPTMPSSSRLAVSKASLKQYPESIKVTLE